MRTRVGAAALAGVTLLAMGTGAGSSAAATAKTWTVRPGGAVAAKGTATLADPQTDASLTCTSATMTGTLKAGGGLPGAGIGSVTAAAFTCPAMLPVRLTAAGLPWRLSLSGYDRRTGTARGTISHLRLALSAPACRAVVNGTGGAASDGVVAVSYSGKTGKLKIIPAGGGLHWYHVRGCAGLFGNGAPAVLAGAYAISPRQVITSP